MDRRFLALIFVVGLLSGSVIMTVYFMVLGPKVWAYFSPEGGCEQILIYYISNAKRSIHVLIFSFTLDSVADALIKAHGRGVEVKVVFEAEQEANQPIYERLKEAGIEVRKDANPSFMHDKVAIIDGELVLTGSYNWTSSAEHANNENLVVIKDRAIAKKFEEEFWRVWSQAQG